MVKRAFLVSTCTCLLIFGQTRVDYPTQLKRQPNVISDYNGAYTSITKLCSDANAISATASLTVAWKAVTTQTLSCPLQYNGGSIQPAAGQVVTISGALTWPDNQPLCDISLGGSCVFSGTANPRVPVGWFGATCGGVSSHDDAPGINAAFAAIRSAGFGTPIFPGTPGTKSNCWVNSYVPPGNTVFNLVGMSNFNPDLRGVVWNTTLTLGGQVWGVNSADMVIPGWYIRYITVFNTAHDAWASPSADPKAGAVSVILSPASAAGNYHKGDGFYIQSGVDISTTPFNAESGLVATDGNPSTGEVDFQSPLVHSYTNDSMNPFGITNVTSNSVFNIHIDNFTTAPSFTIQVAAPQQCFNCGFDNVTYDGTQDSVFESGTSYNLRITNSHIHMNYAANVGQFFQVSTGMTHTWFINDFMSCTTFGNTSPGISLLAVTEGSGDTEIIGGEWDGNGCSFAGSTYTGFKVIGAKIVLQNVVGQPDFQLEAGGGTGSEVNISDNDITILGATSKTPIFLQTPGLIFARNRITTSTIGAGNYAIQTAGNMAGSKIIDNHVVSLGGQSGLLINTTDNHSLMVRGNDFNSSMATVCLSVDDNGQQTVPLILTDNYCNGFGTDLDFASFAHEFNDSLWPNAFNDAIPYAPATAAIIPFAAISAMATGTEPFIISQSGMNMCAVGAPPAVGGNTLGEFVAQVSGTCQVTIGFNGGGASLGLVAPHKWDCASPKDLTTPGDTLSWFVVAATNNGIEIQGTSVAGDTIQVGPCFLY